MKIARRAAHEKGEQERMTILCAGAFHGRTLGMPQLLIGLYSALVLVRAAGFDHVPFGNLNKLRDAMVRTLQP